MDQNVPEIERDGHARHDGNGDAGGFRHQALWTALRNIQVVRHRTTLRVQIALRKCRSRAVTLPAEQVVR